MSPNHDTLPPNTLSTEVINAFGDFDALRTQFIAAGMTLQGSGWAALSWEPVSGSLVVEQIHDHQSNICAGSFPLLVMDMWEHAYYLDYRNGKERWVKAFWDLINWRDVSDRLAARQGGEARFGQVSVAR